MIMMMACDCNHRHSAIMAVVILICHSIPYNMMYIFAMALSSIIQSGVSPHSDFLGLDGDMIDILLGAVGTVAAWHSS